MTDELIVFVKNEFELDQPQSDGQSLRTHLQSVERQTGITPEQLSPVEVGDELAYIWKYFISMNRRRTSSGFGPNPISSLELIAWANNHGIPLNPFEVEVLDSIELEFLKAANRKDND